VGSDDLFHKIRVKTARDLARKKEKRASYERVLIVCEGEKTEPNYFKELKDCLELNNANVEIDGNCGSSPISVVKYAKKRCLEEKKTGDGFDKVYCVFDKDTHESYDAALLEITNLKPKETFHAAHSVPCFEFWLLLHFIYTNKPYIRNGTKSSCANLIDDLKKYIPDYEKGCRDIYSKIADNTDQAIAHSKRALSQAQTDHTDNPTTHIHKLVEYLKSLKETEEESS